VVAAIAGAECGETPAERSTEEQPL